MKSFCLTKDTNVTYGTDAMLCFVHVLIRPQATDAEGHLEDYWELNLPRSFFTLTESNTISEFLVVLLA